MVRSPEPGQGARQRSGYGSEGHSENLRDFPIAKAFGAEVKASPVLLRQCAQDRRQLPLPLAARQFLLRVQGRVRQGIDIGRGPIRFSFGVPPFQGQIVRDAKEPTAQVRAGLALLQVEKQGQEHFLHDLFGIVQRQSEGRKIPEQRGAPLLEQIGNLLVQTWLAALLAGYGGQ